MTESKATSSPASKSGDSNKAQPSAAKPSVADVLPASSSASAPTQNVNIEQAAPPNASAPQNRTLNEQAGDAEEKDGGPMGGLGKLAKNSMSPWILMGLLAAASMMGAPMWMVVAGGLIGWALVAAGRNSDTKPQGNGDVALTGAPNQGQAQAQGRGQSLDVAIGGANNSPMNNNLDVALNGSSKSIAVGSLNGIQHDSNNNDVVLPPAVSPANVAATKQQQYANGF